MRKLKPVLFHVALSRSQALSAAEAALLGENTVLDLGPLTDKFSESGQKVIYRAIEESRRREHNFLSVEHIFTALGEVEGNLFTDAMQAIGVDPAQVKQILEGELAKSRQYVGKKMYIADQTRELFNRALKRARQHGRQTIDAIDLFVTLFSDTTGVPAEILRRLGVDPTFAVDKIARSARSREEQDETLRKKYELPPYLKHFGVSLNKLARQDKLPPTIGREQEIRQMIEILCHRERANSPMLVGEPGVGKTAVVEGLARLIELEP
ncbi:MAG TPA: Clp protease N-terminal domain-containing protein, partial [Blastocatellia bacterium]|nr:Clp protease N-terminal domain-containing protein [Blastocatellia bacterium]